MKFIAKLTVLVLGAIIALLLIRCNPVKRMQKQQEQLSELVDKVNAKRIIENKDSASFIPGVERSKRDTLLIIDSSNGKTVERYYFNNYSFTKDTIKIFTRDIIKENALFSENERHKARLEAAINDVTALKKRELVLSIIIAACLMGGGLLLKSKLF